MTRKFIVRLYEEPETGTFITSILERLEDGMDIIYTSHYEVSHPSFREIIKDGKLWEVECLRKLLESLGAEAETQISIQENM